MSSRGNRGGAATPHGRRIRDDAKAQMSFSLVAVLILMISSTSLALVSQSQDGSQGGSLASMDRMRDLAATTAKDCEALAYSIAVEMAVNSSNEEGQLGPLFPYVLDVQTARTYPRNLGGYLIEVNLTGLHLDLLAMPAAGILSATYPGQAASIPAYLALTGAIKVNVSRGGDFLCSDHSVDRGVYVPLPLLVDRLDRFQAMTEGGSALLWRIVQAELSAMLQMRLVSMSSIGPGLQTEPLTEADVRNAYVLASILLQIACFRNYDRSLLKEFAYPDGTDLDVERLEHHLEDIEGQVDPADLFLALNRLDRISPSHIMAQGLYSTADMLAMRWLDYFRLTDALTCLESLVEAGQSTGESILGRLMGRDLTGEHAKEWLEGLMENGQVDELDYRYLCESSIDAFVDVDSMTVILRNSSGYAVPVILDGSYPVDFSSVDIFDMVEWSEFYDRYRRSTSQLMSSIVIVIKGMALRMTQGSIDDAALLLDPKDERSYIDEIEAIMADSYGSARGGGAQTESIRGLSDPIGESFLRYMEDRSEEIFSPNSTVVEALDGLSAQVMERIVLSEPQFAGAFSEYNVRQITDALMDRNGADILEKLTLLYDGQVSSFLSSYGTWLNGTSSIGSHWLTTTIGDLAKGVVEGQPGIQAWVEGRAQDLVREMAIKTALRADVPRVFIEGMGPFDLLTGRGSTISELIDVRSIIPGPSSGIQVLSICDPWSGAGSRNLHLTDLGDCTPLPYQTEWNITMAGHIAIRLEAGSLGSERRISLERDCVIGTSLSLVGSTGWPLGKVDYAPSNTIDQDLLGLIRDTLDSVAGMIGEIGQGVASLVDYITVVFQALVEYCSEGMDRLVQTTDAMLEWLKGWASSQAMELLARIIEPLSSRLAGACLTFRSYGGDFSLRFSAEEPALHPHQEMLAIGFTLRQGDCHLSVTARVLEMSDRYYLLINGTVAAPGSLVSLVIDPLMGLFDHLVEVIGTVDGRSLEIVLPEFDFKREVSFSLSQLPGVGALLSNIPSPIPGTKFKVDAGFYFKFATPALDHPIINEYEQNPAGRDQGAEWVEIYNPGDTVVSLSGWSLRTSHGVVRIEQLGDTLLLPRDRVVYHFPQQSLDNGDVRSFPFAECVSLLDPSGRRVDSSPFTFDEENDLRTWQRCYDGGDGWQFRPSTQGRANSPLQPGPVEMDTLTGIVITVMAEALEQFEATGYDLTGLGKVMQMAINELAVRLLSVIAEKVAEVGVFVEMALAEASGSLSTCLKTSLLVDGSFLMDAFRWFGQVIQDILDDPFRSVSAETTRAGLMVLTENIWLQVELKAKASLPEFTFGMQQGNEVAVSAKLKANLAQLGEMLGADLGRSVLTGGLVLTDTSSYAFSGPFMAKDRYTKECWLLKVTIAER